MEGPPVAGMGLFVLLHGEELGRGVMASVGPDPCGSFPVGGEVA
jgi:hypothetical protein